MKEKKHHPILQNISVALMEVLTYNLLFEYKDEKKRTLTWILQSVMTLACVIW